VSSTVGSPEGDHHDRSLFLLAMPPGIQPSLRDGSWPSIEQHSRAASRPALSITMAARKQRRIDLGEDQNEAERPNIRRVSVIYVVSTDHSRWKTSSMFAHHSPFLRVGKGSCIGSMMAHHSCVLASAAILAQSSSKLLPWYSR